MITSIKLTGKYAERVGAKRQKSFYFYPGINLLVGPNGSGKSTIFEAIRAAAQEEKKGVPPDNVEIAVDDSISTVFFDFEKQNVRTLGYFLRGGGIHFQVASKFSSHGEVNRIMAKDILETEEVEGACVLVDEPDQALDHGGVVQLLSWLKECKAKQVIAAVHHPFLVLQRNLYVIEMRKGYREDMREHLKSAMGL